MFFCSRFVLIYENNTAVHTAPGADPVGGGARAPSPKPPSISIGLYILQAGLTDATNWL